MDTLRSIDSIAVAITQETVKNLTVGPVKASLPPDRPPLTKKEELVFSWQEQLAWVQQQVKDLEITLARKCRVFVIERLAHVFCIKANC